VLASALNRTESCESSERRDGSDVSVMRTDDGQLRSLKYLSGVVCGCWIVGYDWVTASKAAGTWVDEAPYELADHCGCGGGVSPHAPRHARLAMVRPLPASVLSCAMLHLAFFTLPPTQTSSVSEPSRCVKPFGPAVLNGITRDMVEQGVSARGLIHLPPKPYITTLVYARTRAPCVRIGPDSDIIRDHSFPVYR
jgi:hypothetical protein